MIELCHRIPEPVELAKFRTKYPNASWSAVKFNSVRHVVRRQLNIEQEGHCAYCESKLSNDEGHIDHIKPKKYSALTFVYDNLAHSCDNIRHCAIPKGAELLPIEPRRDCNAYFSLSSLDGRIDVAMDLADVDAERVRETVELLKLNHSSLAW